MPNHVKNIMTVGGDPKQVLTLLNTIKSDEGDFDFNTVIPQPEKNDDWYSWRIDKWNTKWGAYEVEVSNDTVYFQTAWSTALPIFKKLSELFPELELVLEYADEDLGHNCGKLVYKGGELVSEYEGDLKEACRIWGYDYEEVLAEYQGEGIDV